MASYLQLEPSSFSDLGLSNVPGFNSSNLSFYDTSSFIYTLFFIAIIGAAFYEYVLVGVYRMEASESGIRKSNETFRRTTLGLLGVFSLFLIIFTLNKSLLTGNVGLGKLKADPVPATNVSSTSSNVTAVQNDPQTSTPSIVNGRTYAERKASHDANAASLWAAGINTNKVGQLCSAEALRTGAGCTSLAYLWPETITMLKNLKGVCPDCAIVITGGTEPGHSSHCEGGGNVDLRLLNTRNDPNNPDPLYVFLKKNATKTDVTNNCYIRYYYDGYKFCDERAPRPQHFHVDSQKQCRNGQPI